ncbi:MAG: YfhO family protein [Clostridia bacterium]|nr:YfhO family protein [Clostridia bacterium]
METEEKKIVDSPAEEEVMQPSGDEQITPGSDADAPAEEAEATDGGGEKKRGKFAAFLNKITKSPYFYLVGAFFLPVLLMLGAHAAASFYPFGNQSILSLDFQAQYIYYFEQIRRLLTEGGSWLYTWSRTLGGEFMGYVAYYMGSPFNVIVALFPDEQIAIAASAVVLSKIGAAGVTMGLYLHKTRGTRELKTLIFSSMYALCGYVAIQQYNPMWLDAVVWLPMLIWGIEKLVKDRKPILYIVSLTLIITANYYIGYMCCIFTAIYFLAYYFLVRPELLEQYRNNKSGIKKFFSLAGTRAFLRMAGATLTTLFLSSFMLICAYYSLSFGKVGFSNPSFAFTFRFDFLDVFVKMLVGSHDTVRENGLPVVYSGMFALILIPVFFMSKEISARKKVFAGALIGVLIVSFLLNPVDLVWHGFSSPNWLNYRYSFMFSFVVVTAACDAFINMDKSKYGRFALSSVVTLIIVCIVQKLGYEFKQNTRTVELDDMLCIGLSVLFVLIYLGVMYFVLKTKDGAEKSHGTATLILALIVSIELFANSIISVAFVQKDVGVVRYNNYPASATSTVERYDSYNGSVERLRAIARLVMQNDKSFYRMEANIYRARGGVNEQMAVGYNGIASSTSTLNKETIRFLAKLGYASTSHWTKYLGGTPVSDALLGIKYVLSTDRPTEANGATLPQNNKHSFDSNFFVKSYEVDEPSHITPAGYKLFAMQNTKALPIAYGVSSSIKDFESVFTMSTYYAAPDLQNRMINAMLSETLGDVNVWKPLRMRYSSNNASVSSTPITYNWDGLNHTSEYFVVNSTGDGASITFTVTAVTDGIVYFHFPAANFAKTAKVYVNNKFLTDYFGEETSCTMELGKFNAGDTINVEVVLNNDKIYISHSSTSFFWYIDYEAATKAFDYLEASSIYVEDYGNDFIKGTIDLPAGQTTIFTTIPYDSGWNVYVDGEKVETYKVFDALMAFDASEGFHEIEMRYFPKIYKIGLLTTAIGVAALVVIVLFCLNKKFKAKVLALLPKRKYEPTDGEVEEAVTAAELPAEETPAEDEDAAPPEDPAEEEKPSTEE